MSTVIRRITRLAIWPLAACLALVVATPTPAAAQLGYSGIVVFGTSLSDPGNAFALRGEQGTPHDFLMNPLLVPTVPYAKGGHHFSNGATWIEQFARSVGLGDSVRPALATTDPAVTNYAVGAARAYEDGMNFNLGRQVDAFLARSGGAASPHALYVIEMGGNDIRDAFTLYATGGDGGPVLSRALGAIAQNVQKLYQAGAREFLVWSAPNVGVTPALRSLGPVASGLATRVSEGFNANLAQIVGQLASALPGTRFTRFDAFALQGAILASPASYGLANVTAACITPDVAPFDCSRPSDYLFWDGIHPTKAGHAILARHAADVIR